MRPQGMGVVARLAVVGWLVVSGCAGSAVIKYDYASEPDPRKQEYVIGVSDKLTIRVWKNGDLSADVTVRPDGTITMPLIGDLKAAGQTPSQLRDAVTTELAKYIKDEGAVVTIAVTAVNSYSFVVSGNVEHAGTFRSDHYVTVMEAVQLAGGPNRYASPDRLKLFRVTAEGTTRVIPINYDALLGGKRPDSNLALFSGDQLHMP